MACWKRLQGARTKNHRTRKKLDSESKASAESDAATLVAFVRAARTGRDDLVEPSKPMWRATWMHDIDRPTQKRRDPQPTKETFPWAPLALAELADSGWLDTEDAGPQLANLAVWMVDDHQTLRRSGNTGYATLGLAAAANWARGAEHERAAKLSCATDRSLARLLSWQAGHDLAIEGLSGAQEEPHISGGVQMTADDPEQRLDYAGFVLGALLEWRSGRCVPSRRHWKPWSTHRAPSSPIRLTWTTPRWRCCSWRPSRPTTRRLQSWTNARKHIRQASTGSAAVVAMAAGAADRAGRLGGRRVQGAAGPVALGSDRRRHVRACRRGPGRVGFRGHARRELGRRLLRPSGLGPGLHGARARARDRLVRVAPVLLAADCRGDPRSGRAEPGREGTTGAKTSSCCGTSEPPRPLPVGAEQGCCWMLPSGSWRPRPAASGTCGCDAVATNFELHTLLAAAPVRPPWASRDPTPKSSPGLRGSGPRQLLQKSESMWALYAHGAYADLLADRRVPMEQWIWNESIPAEIPEHGDTRVIVAGPPVVHPRVGDRADLPGVGGNGRDRRRAERGGSGGVPEFARPGLAGRVSRGRRGKAAGMRGSGPKAPQKQRPRIPAELPRSPRETRLCESVPQPLVVLDPVVRLRANPQPHPPVEREHRHLDSRGPQSVVAAPTPPPRSQPSRSEPQG